MQIALLYLRTCKKYYFSVKISIALTFKCAKKAILMLVGREKTVNFYITSRVYNKQFVWSSHCADNYNLEFL